MTRSPGNYRFGMVWYIHCFEMQLLLLLPLPSPFVRWHSRHQLRPHLIPDWHYSDLERIKLLELPFPISDELSLTFDTEHLRVLLDCIAIPAPFAHIHPQRSHFDGFAICFATSTRQTVFVVLG